MTLRVYRDEYEASFLKQIEAGEIDGLSAIKEESTEKVLMVEGSMRDLTSLQCLMYRDEEAIKKLFSSYITTEQQLKKEKDMMVDAIRTMRDRLLSILALEKQTGRLFSQEQLSEMFDDMRIAYLALDKKFESIK